MRPRLVAGLVALLLASAPPRAGADDLPSPDAGPDADATARARAAFVAGAELAALMLWGEALVRFEESARLRPHAGTTYNIGVCQRSLGQYTRARATLRRALAEDARAGGGELAEDIEGNIAAHLAELELVIASLEVTLAPRRARISVDGRPLEHAGDADGAPVLIAGTLAAGPGRAPPAGRFRLFLDPGRHVFVISRKGFSDAVVEREVAPGSRGVLALELERLPGTLHIAASEPRAAVAVDGVDIGLAPVVLSRPAGSYHVRVQKDGFDPYETDVTLSAAQRVDLLAPMRLEEPGLHERWWFWATLGGAIASAVVTTYVATRPEPERAPLDGGSLGWTIRVP
jgi:hypothetical protein